MKPRVLTKTLLKSIKTFPAVVVTGPRQSGKTTLLKKLFSSTHRFLTLEDPDVRMRAIDDPRSFLDHYAPPVIIDEIQYVPDLLSYIKTKIDERRKPGQWLFTGSQNFVVMQGVSESLAGRAAVFSLLPFSFAERINQALRSKGVPQWIEGLSASAVCRDKTTLHELLLRGDYPEIASKKNVQRHLWCGSYIATYLERDVRNLAHIGDFNQFERFLRLCATRTAQLLNLSEMAKDIGVSVPTAKRWLSILEASYQVYLLYPYYKNLGKRLIKSPKLYFCDTALASYLLGIHNYDTLINSPSFGALFETMVVNDVLKRFLNSGQMPALYYLRTRDGLEVDLVLEVGQKLCLFEIKSSMTVTLKHASSLVRATRELSDWVKAAGVISNSKDNYPLAGRIMNYGWKNILAL